MRTFTRFKQAVKEKTGLAQASKLPPEIEEKMSYVNELKKNNEKMAKSMKDIADNWKKNSKRNEIASLQTEMKDSLPDKINESSMAMAEFLKQQMEMEKKGFEVIGKFDEKMKRFNNSDLPAMVTACTDLKRKRQLRDSAANDYEKKPNDQKKATFEANDNDFKTALEAAKAQFEKIPEFENSHAQAITECAKELADVFKA